MKIYVAGKFEKKEEIRKIYKKLESLGHSISYDWTTHKFIKPYVENQQQASTYAQNELNGICQSDVLIYIAEENGHTLPMEFGAALAMAKTTGKPRIFAVGKHNCLSPWFFNPLIKRVNKLEEVLKALAIRNKLEEIE